MAMQKHRADLPGASGSRKSGVDSVQIGVDLWVIDAFQKKSKQVIKTPQIDVDRSSIRTIH
jgi:hypothetical protein